MKDKKLDEAIIDRAVRRVLKQKFEMGLFDNPYVKVEEVKSKVNTEVHHKLALKAAEETMVLLKNENQILPLNTQKPLTIAVIGPNADRKLLGGYSGEPSYFVTVLEGIKAKFGDKNTILYAKGCGITKDSVLKDGKYIKTGWGVDPVEMSDRAENLKQIAYAKEIAQKADIVILCVGDNEQTSREAWVEEHLGDRASLDLVGEQNELIDAIKSTGKPIVSLLFNGKPLSVNNLYAKSDALIECWYLGSECGNAVANVLSGAVNPSGKLPISFPRSVGHIPCFYNYKPTARRGYLFDDVSPLFSFGYGLSYTKFEYSKQTLSVDKIKKDGEVFVYVTIENKGKYSGQEIVQLYIRDDFSSVTRPIKDLKAFQKIQLAPGESKKVSFKITAKELSFWTIDKKYAVEAGSFTLMVGSSSKDQDLEQLKLFVVE